MDILGYVSKILGLCGCLQPRFCTSIRRKILYRAYATIVWLTIYGLALSQILDLIFNVDNQDDFSDNFYVTLGVFGICFKMCILLINRKTIKILIDTLQREPFSPMSVEELETQMKFNKIAEWNAIAITIIIKFYITSMFVASFLTDFKHKKLLYRAWLPYDLTSPVLFTITYVHQIVGIIYCSFTTVACDSLFSGFMIHIYCQFEILGHRLKSIKINQNDSAKRCALLHDHIYKYATTVNEVFAMIMFSQSLMSLLIVCFNLYQLTQRELGSKFVETLLYSFNTLMQIFYYCWYGNEVKLKSLSVPETIFATDWTTLDKNTTKMLLMIMKRATVPIEFSSIHIISMNLNTFTTLIKTSYSAYNLLQRGQG